MTKELKALEQLKYYNTLANDDFDMTEELSIIETALKDLSWYKEQLEDFDIKENQLRETFIVYKNYQADQKKLKALEYLKSILGFYIEDNVLIITPGRKNETIRKLISDENSDLLKEVLL